MSVENKAEPIPAQQMNVAAPAIPADSITTREYRHGFWDCFSDPADCLIACCCTCVTYGQAKSKFTGHEDECVKDSAIFCVASYFCLAPALSGWFRHEVREKYHIHQPLLAHDSVKQHATKQNQFELAGKKDGKGLVADLVTAYCCLCCQLIQDKREVDSITNNPV